MMTCNKIPPFEIELILAHILKKSREYVLAHPERTLNKTQNSKFNQLVKRRENHEPMAYILGQKEFYGLDFKVTQDTLIPRPETELLVEEIIKLEPKNKTVIDIGTGSGNIIISLAKNIKNKNNFFAADISEKALRIARRNAKNHGVDKKIKFIKSDLLNYFFKNKKSLKIVNCKLIIASNLPYLSQKIYATTAPNVKNFEPKSALFSNKDGLAHYEKLFQQIKKLQNNCNVPHIMCYAEFSPEQKPSLAKLIKKYFPKANIKFRKDLGGKWRIAEIKL
ncbi:MAG: peptide chain release factor N(5)-glutamine methyltransferase [Candidatus Pacebacteria bacterium]|nr:peptide chain release factor N(5)-glutamine methyltransferase [Candidatus Paceibacterota bacterium]MDR3583452.1 peptide chain release factor N(5)-glutamine methyltransferase [Candidatus Paceibacterota bacterium]